MKPGVFREEYIAIIVRELLRGLDYLHMEGKLHRDIKGTIPYHLERFIVSIKQLYSGEHSALSNGRREARRLWRLRPALRDPLSQEKHLRRYTVLDVSGGHQAVWIRLQGGHMESWDHGDRACEGGAAVCGAPPYESVVFDPEEPTAAVRHGIFPPI